MSYDRRRDLEEQHDAILDLIRYHEAEVADLRQQVAAIARELDSDEEAGL